MCLNGLPTVSAEQFKLKDAIKRTTLSTNKQPWSQS